MTLFTKAGCSKCDYVKSKVDLEALGVKIEEIGPDNPEALALLAWHQLIPVAEKHLPILVMDDSSYIVDAVPILRYLKGLQSQGA
jgi:glutaredoxin 2